VTSVIGSVIGGLFGLGSSANQASAAEQAGQETADATKYAANLQNQQFQQVLGLEMPGYRVGQGALGLYASALGLPGFALEQGATAPGYSYTGTSAPGGSLSTSPSMTLNRSFDGYSEGGLTTAQAQSILQARPDIGQAFNALEPNIKASFGNDPANYASYWYNRYGQPSGFTIPTAATTPTGTGTASGGSLTDQNAGALNAITGGQSVSDYVKSQPGYQDQLQQGLDAVNARAAATGGGPALTGSLAKALDDYGQKTFGGYYQNWLSQVGALSGLQGSSASGIASAGQTAAGNIGNLAVTGAGALGQAGVNAANAWSTGLGGATGAITGALNTYYGAPSYTSPAQQYGSGQTFVSPETYAGYNGGSLGYTGSGDIFG
jgi:hypothetical protein